MPEMAGNKSKIGEGGLRIGRRPGGPHAFRNVDYHLVMAPPPDSPVLNQALAAIGNRIVAAFAVAFIAAAIWAHLADASFVERLGWCLAIAGAATTMPRTGA